MSCNLDRVYKMFCDCHIISTVLLFWIKISEVYNTEVNCLHILTVKFSLGGITIVAFFALEGHG